MGIAKVNLILFPVFFLSACIVSNTSAPAQHDEIPRVDVIPAEQQKITPEQDVYPPILHVDEWENPIPLEGPINTAGLEDSPFISPEGDTFYFFFTPSASAVPIDQINDGTTGIYMTYKVEGEWIEPQRVWLSQPGKTTMEGCPTLVGDILWFCSIREGNYRDIDFWTAHWNGEEWVDIQNAGQRLNQELGIGELHISQDFSTIYFHAENTTAESRLDIWQTSYINGDWSDPINLSAVNSTDDDSRPTLSANGNELWFTRNYQGAPAIFRSKLENGEWQSPELIISHFAGEPSIDQDGNIYFVHHFFKDSTMLEADIYFARKK